MSLFDLSDKTAWVTGYAQSLGKEIIKDFAEMVADVVVCTRSNTEKLRETEAELDAEYNVDVFATQFDVADTGSVGRAVSEITDELGDSRHPRQTT
jgi:NAD(P)-dependent dehydrogenase (short-subunit alcohol dehydrogenase family)